MKKFALLIVIALSLFACKKDDDNGSQSGQTQSTHTLNLKVDSYTTEPIVFQTGFLAGEAAAVTLGPVDNTFKITYIKFILGGTGNAVPKNVNLKIYIDGGNTDPDSLIFSSTYSLISADESFQVIDLRSDNIIVTGGGSIRVAVEPGDGLPSVAVDEDGTIDIPHNWIYTGGTWTPSSQLGMTSDFIIRAIVEENN